MDVGTSVDVPLLITMKLDPQGHPVYAEAASRPPQRDIVTKDTVCMCDIWMRDAARGVSGYINVYASAYASV